MSVGCFLVFSVQLTSIFFDVYIYWVNAIIIRVYCFQPPIFAVSRSRSWRCLRRNIQTNRSSWRCWWCGRQWHARILCFCVFLSDWRSFVEVNGCWHTLTYIYIYMLILHYHVGLRKDNYPLNCGVWKQAYHFQGSLTPVLSGWC